MKKILVTLPCLLLLSLAAISLANTTSPDSGKQTLISPGSATAKQVPLVVIYTLSTCPHCMEAKEYLTTNNIPFINREVDTDDEYMRTLLEIYDSMGVPEQKRGVPLFVIGNRIRIQGFNKEKLQKALKEVTSSQK